MIKVENGIMTVAGNQQDITVELSELITSMLDKEPSIMVGVLSFYTELQKSAVQHASGKVINEVYRILTVWEDIKKENPNE